MSARPQAADLREALLAETLDEVAHLHDTVQALAPKLQTIADPIIEAISEALTRAKKEVSKHAHDQATYVEQVMLRDRERFAAEQKAALDALDERLRKRDAGLVTLMADAIEKAREQMGIQSTDARPEKTGIASLAAGALGLVIGTIGSLGGMLLMLHFSG